MCLSSCISTCFLLLLSLLHHCHERQMDIDSKTMNSCFNFIGRLVNSMIVFKIT